MKKQNHNYLPALIFWALFWLSLFAGWVNHVVWTFAQTALGPILLGILGVLSGPIGAVHGLYRFFV